MAHLRKRGDKTWQITIETGIDPRTGKRKRMYKTVNGTKKQAEKVMHKLAAKYEEDGFIKPTQITIKEYFLQWLKEYAKNNVSIRTYQDYEGVIRNHVIPRLGRLKLKDLQQRHIITYQNEKLEDGRLDGKGGLSKRTVQNHHRILSEALSHAVFPYKYIKNNPCNGVKAPSPDDPDIYPLSYEEADILLNYVCENYSYNIYALFYVSLYTGLRRSEILALRWRNVSIDNLNLHVTEAVDEITGEGLEYGDTKNDASKRTVDYDEDVAETIRTLQKKYLKNYKIDKLVFLHEDGSEIRPDYITKLFRKIADKQELYNTRFHDLRHTHATWLLQAGVNPKVVQERLGHASITTTLKIYSHVIPSMQKDAVKKLKKSIKKEEWRQNGDKIKNLPVND
ncbi:MAG: site-specific integrase [Firmicutes bacterium]|nr:site-specific integrase [Bacillota bacterium]